jgi:hypothetical protein
MFACGKFESSSYEQSTPWASTDLVVKIPGLNEIEINGIVGNSGVANGQNINTPDNYQGWGYTSVPNAALSGPNRCAEKRHLYCVGPYPKQ